MYILWLWNTTQSFSISNMVLEPLLWPLLSSLVFISVTQFSTSLSPSQQSPQPLTVEPLMPFSCRLWVPDLQPLSLRSPTPYRPLHKSSLPWILLRLHFYKYHWDRLVSIYMSVETSQSSETARTFTCHSKLLCQSPRTPHAVLSSNWRHMWRHSCHVSPSLCQHLVIYWR